jgi:hypothetical protein
MSAATPIRPAAASAFGLIERLLRLSDKLEVVATRFREAEAAEELPSDFTGEIFITVDAAEELGALAHELDEWARENGAPQVGRLTAEPAEGQEVRS